MKNEQTAKAFSIGYGDGINGTKNLITEEINGVLVIYSYGSHFPISIKFDDGFLFNKDGYSQSTTRHKNLILANIKDQLSDGDFMTTQELKQVIDAIKYNSVRSKAELVEQKI